MKYLDLNIDDDFTWQKNLNLYYSYLESIKSRFSKKFFCFYTKEGMHDSILLDLQIVKRALTNGTVIDVNTLWEKSGKQFSLIFKDVKSINMNINLLDGYCEFGDYIAGEFSAVNEQLLSFEFLFYDCENTVKLIFKKIHFKT